MCAITNLGVSCDLGTSPAAVCSPVVPPVVGLWPGLPLTLTAWGEREDMQAPHRALPSHPGAERVYKGRNTDGSSVSVVKSSTTELWHFMPYCPGGVSGLDCSRIYRLIRGTLHHTLRSISSAGQRWNYWVWGGTLQEFPVFPNHGILQIIGPSYSCWPLVSVCAPYTQYY